MTDPPTHVFVDGNNLMGARPDGWWRDRRAAQRRVVAQLEDVARRAGGRWTVVFDGAPPRGKSAARLSPSVEDARRAESAGDGALRVEFASRRGPNAADGRIVALLRALPEDADAVVYTSDRRLRERVRALGARVEGVSNLLHRMELPPSPDDGGGPPRSGGERAEGWGEGSAPVSWADFEAAEPELAALGRALFLETQLVLLGSLRKDGWPRISPVEPLFFAGELYLGMMWRSYKALDLRRDSRCLMVMVMNTVHDRMLKDGEFKLTGRAVEVEDTSERAAYEAALREQLGFDIAGEDYHLFKIAIATASFAKIENEDWVRKFWRVP